MSLLLAFSLVVREFRHVPEWRTLDESVLSKLKITFVDELAFLFENLTFPVIGIFSEYDESLPNNSPDKGKNAVAIYDTLELKPKVKENNPKFFTVGNYIAILVHIQISCIFSCANLKIFIKIFMKIHTVSIFTHNCSKSNEN